MENHILTYKINDNNKKVLEKICKNVNKNIKIIDTDIPEDIVGIPAFMAYVNADIEKTKKQKEYVFKCINFVKDYMNVIIADNSTFMNLSKLKQEIENAYENYNYKNEGGV